MYLLDTDVIINHLKGRKRIPINILQNSYISVITYAELLYGLKRIKKHTTILANFLETFKIDTLSITPATMKIYVKMKLDLEKQGKRLADFDLLIGATAIIHRLILCSRNIKHFSRIKNLSLKKI